MKYWESDRNLVDNISDTLTIRSTREFFYSIYILIAIIIIMPRLYSPLRARSYQSPAGYFHLSADVGKRSSDQCRVTLVTHDAGLLNLGPLFASQ